MAKISFIGMGVMGFPMAGHLAKNGHDVTVYNRSSKKAELWVGKFGGSSAPTPKEAAIGADFVISCVGNDDDLRSVTLGADGAFGSMAKGSVFIDHTTASADIARELGEAANGFDVIDAPVSGGQAGAENGVLAIMCGGEKAVFERAEPIMECYGKTVKLIGGHGAGQQCKMVNQIAIAGLVQALSEALNFSKRAGLDGSKVLEVITGGAAGSWQMANRGQTMLDDQFDFGFAVDWMRKDLGIVMEEAARIGADLPVTKIVDQFYGEVQDMGGNRLDTSSLIKRLS